MAGVQTYYFVLHEINDMKFFRKGPKRLVKALAVIAFAAGIGSSAPGLFAATAAGTQIKNLATVTYEDGAGNVYSAQSNEAIVTVAQVYSATIGTDIDRTAAPGQTVYLPYILTNTGNGSDDYDFSAVNGITGNDSIDSGNIVVYEDVNGNGVPDSGEPVLSSATLAMSDIINIVVAVDVPTTATAGQTLGITLTAAAHEGTGSAVASSVTDITTGKGLDGLDGTNESLITVTGDAVLVTTKSSVHNAGLNEITYTVTVKNNGNSSAKNVVIFDGIPAGTTYESSSVSGLLGSNGDTTDISAILNESSTGIDFNADGDATDTDETTLGLDLNTDGDTNDSAVNGVYAIDAELPPQTTVSMTFTVSYDPAVLGGGHVVKNVGYASGDTNDSGTPDTVVPSNTVQDVVAPGFGVDIADTGINGAAGVNDGGDDDNTLNDDQFVDVSAAGGDVWFANVVTNTGNANDIFELSVNPGNFPTGTVFTLYDQSGSVLLTDSNNSGVDTGVVASGASVTIMVKATLPANASGNAPLPATEYEATITAVSSADPAATPASDTVKVSLGTIVVATADIHNSDNGTIGGDEDPLGTAPYNATQSFAGQPGTTVNIPLYIDNESGSSDSYTLNVGGSFDGTTLGSLPAGWTVEFYAGDGNGNPVGSSLSSTPVMPGGELDFEIIAVVSIPADASLAVSDYLFDNDGDGNDDQLDGFFDGTAVVNQDGDGDYPFFFQILSQNTGATDIVLEAIDVSATRAISLVTPGSNQLDPGGSVDYGHTLSNSGNLPEVVELESSNSQSGWTHTLSIDTDGDGASDTEVSNLTLNNTTPFTILVMQSNGTVISVLVTDTDGDNIPELTLEPGFQIPLDARVFAPTNAAPGQVDTLTISATNTDTSTGAPSATVSDQTTVINSQVRIDKTVAVDALCDGTADTAFAAIQTVSIEPGQCAIWQVVAENQGAADAYNVIITDAIPPFSDYEPSSLIYCLSNGCLLDSIPDDVSDAADLDEGQISGSNLFFFVGTNPDPANGLGGTLVPGEKATAQFSVRVQ